MDNNNQKSSGKEKAGYIIAGIGVLGILVALIKAFIIGYTASDLVWMFAVGIGGFILAAIGGKLMGVIGNKDE